MGYYFILTSQIFLDGPGIENFQICGDAIPGEKLLGCGYPVRRTSLCMFQVNFFPFVFNFSSILISFSSITDIIIILGFVSVGSASSGWH